jgi:hypothetical protein
MSGIAALQRVLERRAEAEEAENLPWAICV